MRFKVVPEPRDVDLAAVQRAVPLVPDPVEDCCTLICDRTGIPGRDTAREWLTFAQALELVEETDQGFKRTRREPDPDHLADAFRRRVFGAREVLTSLGDGPRTVDEAFEDLRGSVPEWERDRHTDWEAEWRERTRRLLAWSARFGLAERSDDRYRLADRDGR